MSLLNAFKKSLGLGETQDDELLDDSIEPVIPEMPHQVQTVQPMTEMPAQTELTIDSKKIDNIFDYVVATFNEALPTFLRDSVDSEAQKRKLYEGLDASVKNYLATLSQQTRRDCEARWAAEQANMRSEMDALKQKAKDIEQQRFDVKQQQLSADRQRRALAERVHDLEIQLASLEAEREQFDLENKSLINKLKVAGIHENEVENLSKQLSEAQAEILRMRNEGASAPTTSNDEALTSEIETLKNKIETYKIENESLSNQLAAAVDKDRIGNEMLNGLQTKASEARRELEAKDKEIEQLKARLNEADAMREEIGQLCEQMQQVEKVNAKRDLKIAKLKDTCDNLRSENAELQNKLAEEAKAHEETEAQLRERIAELESDPTSPIVSTDIADGQTPVESIKTEESSMPKISEDDLAAIEESFDNATWLQSEPIETPSMRTGISEAEFGYQAPTKKNNHPDNDAQLSLF